MWFYKEKEISEIPENMIGFVYVITNLITGKQYIGKKNFFSKKRIKLKSKKNKKTIKTESDWRNYFGSNLTLLSDIQNSNKINFKRNILFLCKSKAEMSYLEIQEQINKRVLFLPEKYYNNFIGCRIHSKHLKNNNNLEVD